MIVVLPLLSLFILAWFSGPAESSEWNYTTILVLFGFNLILGPLGEELGWRAFMQERLQGSWGWLGASLVVGAVLFAWHLPLWMVDSPQRAIPLLLFGVHVMAYSVLIGAAYTLSNGSIVPAILLH